MEEFKQGFIEEALQLAEQLEELLLHIEGEEVSDANIQEIFRVMHTIKGSAAMFGFANTEKITHRLEDVYDLIRDGKFKINSELINYTVLTIDIVKDLLKNDDSFTPQSQTNYNNILSTLEQIIPTQSEKDASEEEYQIFDSLEESIKIKSTKYFYIYFKPDTDILQRGISPVNVFEELSEFGEITGFPYTDDVPSPEEYDPVSFFLAWDIFIKTKNTEEDIEDCFLFYLDHEYKVIEFLPNDLESNTAILSTCINLNKGNISVDDIKYQLKNKFSDKTKDADDFTKGPEIKNKETDFLQANILETTRSIESIKVDSKKLDELINLVSELVTLNSRLEIQTEDSSDEDLSKTIKSVSKLSKRFRDNALELRLMPVKVLILKLQRLIRDLSKSLNKEIEFITQGTQTELDKNIIAKLEAPLIHILRNSIDHGIESVEERRKAGKPDKGLIRFIAFYSGSNVYIQIQDDGGGIDIEKVKQKAIVKGLIKEDTELSNTDIFNLLFAPGFSTAENITKVSGRGVGLDVVKKDISDMRGEIDIESEKGLGTSFTLKLPLTLSIIDTLLTEVNNTRLLIPREYIIQTSLLKNERNDKSIDKFEFENKVIPVISLRDDFESDSKTPKKQNHVIIKQYEKYYAITVDRIIGEHQAVVKPLGYYNQDHEYFSGASIMGDGSLAFILDVNKLISIKKNKSKVGNYNLK